MLRAYLDPWPWLWSVARAERVDQVDDLWPRFALGRRELLTLCRGGDHSGELKRLTTAVEASPVLGSIRRDQLLEVLAEALDQSRRRFR
jgi:hypothetical protein